MNTSPLSPAIDDFLADPALFSRHVTGVAPRRYQLQVARAVLDSVLQRRGLTFAVLMSRQAGKNETAAQLEALLLLLFADTGGWLVKASPTFQLQTLHSLLRLVELAEEWSPPRVVVDAAGLGEGLASFLAQRLGSRVTPFVSTAATKSQLGWGFLAISETGRFQDHAPDGSAAQAGFCKQLRAARCQLLPGPGRGLRWGVPRGQDDLFASAAVCSELEDAGWATGESFVIPALDPIEEMDRGAPPRRW